jgi:hypothetical protein
VPSTAGPGGKGYGVFSDVGMKMFELQPEYDTAAVLNEFVNSGGEFGANAMAAVKSGSEGGGAAGGVVVLPGERGPD